MRVLLRALIGLAIFVSPLWVNLKKSPILIHPASSPLGMFATVVEDDCDCKYATVDPAHPFANTPEAVDNLTKFVRE